MSQLSEDIGSPISDTDPVGEDIAKLESSPENEEWIRRYARLNELSRTVVGQDEDPGAKSEEMIQLSLEILAGKSKDLKIAGTLCREIVNQKGFAGLADGLKGYHVLLQEYWDKGLYPQRSVARLSNIQLLYDNLAKRVQARGRDKDRQFLLPALPGDGEALEEIKTTAEGIRTALKEKEEELKKSTSLERKLGDADLSLQALIKAVDERLKQPGIAPKKPQAEEKKGWRERISPGKGKPEEEETAAGETRTAGPAPAGDFSSDLGAVKAVIEASRFLLEKSFRNVAAYRLLRTALWHLFVFPAEKKTLVPSPDKSKLEELLKDEDWGSLVIECEAALLREIENGGSSFCLDVQRFLATALAELQKTADTGGDKALKDAYEGLHKVILQETAMFVQRFPEITDVRYSDKVPFADKQTKKWIEESVMAAFGSGSAARESAATESRIPEGDSKISEDFESASELLSRQKWEDALTLMQTGINTEPTRKGRFQRRLNLAELCLDASRPVMARPLLEQLDEEIERFSLDQWEPGLCVQVWRHLRHCYEELSPSQGQGVSPQQGSNGYYVEKADRVFEKLCRLDIRAAMAPKAE